MSRQRCYLLLVLASAIWGFAFVPQRLATGVLGPFSFTGFRFLLGATIVGVIFHREIRAGLNRQSLRAGLVMGALLTGGAMLQQAGLSWTTAGKAAFLTSLYVPFVAVLSYFWGNPPGRLVWTACLLAVLGTSLLADFSDLSTNIGDAAEIAGAVVWAVHVVMAGRYSRRFAPLAIAWVQFVTCGTICSAVAFAGEEPNVPAVLAGFWPLLYGGAVSVGAGYTLQIVAQRHADASIAAIIMGLESVFAALFGWLCLDETLTLPATAGCVMIFIASMLPNLRVRQESALEGE